MSDDEDKPEDGRSKNIAKSKSVRDDLMKLYKDVAKGFQDQNERSDSNKDYWDIYNCQLGANQFYAGNSEIFVPIVYNAIEARKTRYVNQLFPSNNRFVDVTTDSGDRPYAHAALLEHYVTKARLRTKIAPALCVQGDVEGQYTVYVSWKKHKRKVTYKVKKPVKLDGESLDDIDEYDDIEDKVIEDQYPDVEIIPDNDLMILPANADSPEDALNKGGSVTIITRLTKSEVQKYIDDGIFDKKIGESFKKGFSTEKGQRNNTSADNADVAGIKMKGGKKFAEVWQVWTKLDQPGDDDDEDGKLLSVAYFGGKDLILGAQRNPYWCDKCPVISVPVEKIAGVSKGVSPVSKVSTLQYAANDAINEGMDSAAYALLPIIMTDPLKNPRVGSMVLSCAAIWETSPNDTKFAEFPQLWKEAFEIVAQAKNEIFQTLSVSPAIIPQSTGGKSKRNQAEVASEQQVDILTTADAAIILEDLYTQILERFFEYDKQFRDDNITVRTYGELGVRARMEEIGPLQSENYHFKWFGVEASRSAAMLQQQVSLINVVRGIPKEMYPGRTLDLTPAIENAFENVFGPKMAPRIFIDQRKQLSVDIETENEMLESGLEVIVHPMDDDAEHLKKHAPLMKDGDNTGNKRIHMMAHQNQLKQKQEMALQQQMKAMKPKGQPGTPGQPGLPGQPRPGSVPQGPANMKKPNGAIPPDQMKDPAMMPRKM